MRASGGKLAPMAQILLRGTASTSVGNSMTTDAITTPKPPASLSIAATAVVGACILVCPDNDPRAVAGQGTCSRELIEDETLSVRTFRP